MNALLRVLLETTVLIVCAAATPTVGHLAGLIWDTLSGNGPDINAMWASAFYKVSGYNPFCGYPLVRIDEKL